MAHSLTTLSRDFESQEASQLRASAVLLAGNAFDDPAWTDVPSGTRFVSIWVTYTRGAAGGYPVFRCEARSGNATATAQLSESDQTKFTITQPVGQIDAYRGQVSGPQPANGDAITYALTYRLPVGARDFRVCSAEGSAVAVGTLALSYTLASK